MRKICFDCDDPVLTFWPPKATRPEYVSTRTESEICNITGKPHRASYDVPRVAPKRLPPTRSHRSYPAKKGGFLDAVGDIIEGIIDIFT